ncbi:MAG TPA: folylpolyglutamate synthase/dihydrofolate synthase family protein [Polyangia bacterium]|jgi:dihydrofolate synthase/folylpolyglutamate synthase
MAGARYADFLARLDRTRTLGVALGLERTRSALDRLGNPERRVAAVQIAGTNGKGSVAAMTDAILRAAGVHTGLFTSPHLSRFTERIRIQGREIDGDHLAELYDAIVATAIPLTYYEIGTVLAFAAYAEAGVELMVLETGLGGRLDAATTCHPVATAITSIGFDHAEILGSSLAAIAREKAGIAKPDIPLFLAPVARQADQAIAEVAAAVGAPVLRLATDFPEAPFPTALPGAHQHTNAALAVALARTATTHLGRALAPSMVQAGLRDVVWPGRLEWLGDHVLIDCAHNAESAVTLANTLDRLPRGRRALVVSVVAGKAVKAMLAILAPRFDLVIFTRSASPRALGPSELAAAMPAGPGPRTDVADEPLRGLATAREAVGADGLVVVAGSIFLVGDVRAALTGEPRDPVLTSDPPATSV